MKRKSGSPIISENKKKIAAEKKKDCYGTIMSIANEVLLEGIQKDSPNNVVVSPLSFAMVLSMVAVGASGLTLKQILEFLGCKSVDELTAKVSDMMAILSDCDKERSEISILNAVWLDKKYTLQDSFKKQLDDIFKAKAKEADFRNKANKVVEEANSWAKSATRGLIQDVLERDDISSDTILLLANALYFKGVWHRQHKFKTKNTEERKFYLLNGDEVLVPFMSQIMEEAYGSYGTFDGFEVLKLDYTGREFAMYFILPNKKDGLQDLLERFKTNPRLLDLKRLKLYEADTVDIQIPKFKFHYFIKGNSTMMEMGLTLPFDSKCREFDKMVQENNEFPINISNIVQKAYIEVDEEGTKAAAVTICRKGLGCSGRWRTRVAYFVADHPFMFMIAERSKGRVLFSGAVMNALET